MIQTLCLNLVVTLLWQKDWAWFILQSMDWIKYKRTAGKIEPAPKLLAEERFTFQKSIATVVYDHDISSDLFISPDQTTLCYLYPGKYTFNLKEVKNVPIKCGDDKRQKTATFVVSATGNCLPMQLIYLRKTIRYLPNVEFPISFHVTYTENY